MKVRVSSIFCATSAALLVWLAIVTSSTPAAEPNFHHGEWPFNSPVRSAVPNITNSLWAANSIDHFVAASLEKVGLHPGPAADKGALLRRVTYDLIGLPPTRAELDAFLADNSADAYTH